MAEQKLIVITGGGRGIGRVYARHLAQAGARVIITGRDPDTLAKTAAEINGNVDILPFDVTDPVAVQQAFEHIEKRHGPVDVLINNAGVWGPVDLFWRTSPLSWCEAVDINIKGTALCTHAVLQSMNVRRKGIIINIVSNAGIFRWPTCSSYSVTKAAIIKLTENLAVETRPCKISLFAYHPGLVHSEGMSVDTINTSPAPESMEGKVMAWFFNEQRAGRTVDAEQGAEQLLKLISGSYGRLSGRYITVADDLDALLNDYSHIRDQDLLTLRVQSLPRSAG